MRHPIIWFYLFLPNTFCENTRLKYSYDNWKSYKSISIKNLFGHHVFILELNPKMSKWEYKITDCNNNFITLTDRKNTNDQYNNCIITLNDFNENYFYYNFNNESTNSYYSYEISDDYSKITYKNNTFNIFLKNQLIYSGELMNGLFTNYGKLYNNGYLYYQGKFIKGRKHGNGTIFDNLNNKIYSGNFRDDMKNGFGIEYYTNGVAKYQGNWIDNYYDGNGIFYYNDGNVYYEGDWWKGKRFGLGITYNEFGDVLYKGIYINDNIKQFENNHYKKKIQNLQYHQKTKELLYKTI